MFIPEFISNNSSLISKEQLLEVFADFLAIDVSAGDAADDTLITYRRQLQQFLLWCDRSSLHPAEIS
ncbi:MAG: hypothetical protein ACRC6M_17155, partial [Microcystaceae cyanobacterium]